MALKFFKVEKVERFYLLTGSVCLIIKMNHFCSGDGTKRKYTFKRAAIFYRWNTQSRVVTDTRNMYLLKQITFLVVLTSSITLKLVGWTGRSKLACAIHRVHMAVILALQIK